MQIELRNISRSFHTPWRDVCALRSASLLLPSGQTVGILGASGSGKSTLGQIAAGLLKPDSGSVLIDGQQVSFPYKNPLRRKIQILFQHPEVSFNPRLTLYQSLKEPYRFIGKPIDRQGMCEMLGQYGLYAEHLDRYPRELSGGELQRAALARILVLEPECIILDEPTSMLDSISQAQIMKMLRRLQTRQGLSYLFITHQQELAELFSDRIYSMENGSLTPLEKEEPVHGRR